MAKISPVSSKYIIHASINIEGVVDRPDVIGAIFGQTEGLLGSDLELRELQRSGRIGRIEVNVDIRSGKTEGSIIIPSSLDKAETSIVGAALEIIQRIGPCNAKLRVSHIEDVRISKRSFVIERAKQLLKQMTEAVLPDSQELADEVAYSVRVMEIQEYGNDRLAAGPAIDESDEVLVVEGRADVVNLLKHGIKNAISLNGTSVPQTIIELSRKKIITAFVDGDRGGDLIIKELLSVADIDFVTKAPDGKEVEEITKKEIHKALRSKVSAEQMKLDSTGQGQQRQDRQYDQKPRDEGRRLRVDSRQQFQQPQFQRHPLQQGTNRFLRRPVTPMSAAPRVALSPEEKKAFKGMLENLIGTRGAYLIDDKLNILGKVPLAELPSTAKSMSTGVHAAIFDGTLDNDLVKILEQIGTKFAIAMDTNVKQSETKTTIVTINEL